MPRPSVSSLIDTVDRRDHRVGRLPRGEVLGRGANFRTAHVFVFDASGRLLLQQLAPGRERNPGRLGSSVAAYLHSGETYEHAAVRRLREELQLTVPLKSVGKIEMRDERSTKFVALFSATSSDARLGEPDHIAELAYWSVPDVRAAISVDETRFTPTFLQLFSYFLRHRGTAQ